MSAIKDWTAYSAALRERGKELGQLHPEIVKGFVALSSGAVSTADEFSPKVASEISELHQRP